MTKALFLLLLFCFASVACKHEAHVSGEIYIVTRGHDTIKLSATNIFFVPLKDVEEHLHNRNVVDVTDHEEVYFYLKDMPASKYAAYSDADGKFSVELPAGQYAAFALSQRRVFDTTEFYQWLVKVDANGETRLTLNNGNLVDSELSGKNLTVR